MNQSFNAASSLLFFVIYYFYDLYLASLTLSAMSAIQLLIIFVYNHSASNFEKANLAAVAGFGLLTWWFHDARYIQWKVTIIHALLAVALLAYRSIYQSPFFTMLLASQNLDLPKAIANKVDLAMASFLFFVAGLNLFVFQNFSMDTWVYFKSSLIFINLAFIVALSSLVHKHIQKQV